MCCVVQSRAVMAEQFSAFFDAYLQFGFWILHAVIALVAAGAWVRHQGELTRLTRHVEDRPAIGDAEARREVENVERFNSYYDFCANAFILVGLFGTIYGFFTGMAKPSLETGELVRFDQVKPALATSAFGLVWAVVLNLITRVTVERRTDHIRSLYPGKVSDSSLRSVLVDIGDKYAQSIAKVQDTIEAVNHRLEQVFQSGTTNFADASNKLADAAHELQRSSTESAKTFSDAAGVFQKSFDKAAKTASRLDQVTNRVADLPETVAHELLGFSKHHADAMAELSAKLAGQFDAFAARIVSSLAAAAGLPESLGNEMRAAHAEYLRALSESQERFALTQADIERRLNETAQSHSQATEAAVKASADQATKVLDAVDALLKEVQEVPQTLRSHLEQMMEKHSQVLEAQHQVHIQKVNEIVSALKVSAVRELETARQSLEQKGEALRSIYEQAYQEERERVQIQVKALLREIDNFLLGLQKEVLAAVEGAPDIMSAHAAGVRNEMERLSTSVRDCAAELKVSAGAMTEGLRSLHEDSTSLSPAAADLRSAIAAAARSAGQDGSGREQVAVLVEIRSLLQNTGTARPVGNHTTAKKKKSGTVWQRLSSRFKRSGPSQEG